MYKFRTAVLTVAFLALSATAFAKPVKIEYKFRPGETAKYKFVLTTKGTMGSTEQGFIPMDAKMVLLLNQKTLAVMPNGSGKVQITVESARMIIPGLSEPMVMGDVPPITLLMTKSGQAQVISDGNSKSTGSIPGLGGMQFPMGGMIGGTVLPKNPVSVGQTWTETLPRPSTGKASFKLEDDSVKLGKETAAKISYTMSGKLDAKEASSGSGMPVPAAFRNMDSLPFKGKFALYFSPSKGRMVRTDGNMNLQMLLKPQPSNGKTSAKPTKVNLNMNMEMFLLP